jgi:hypothetical protein
MSLCPYCKIRPKLKGKKTCGVPECQHKRELEYSRKYFDKFIRKTDRRVSVSIVRIHQQAAELAVR